MSQKHKPPRFSYKKFLQPTKNVFVPSDVGYFERYPEFSFKHYASDHKKYSFRCIKTLDDFYEMFKRLKALSNLKWKDIKLAGNYHFHEIEWVHSSEPHGFNTSVLKDFPALQFKLFQECRILGFFNRGNVFEIVWIDRHHKIYKRKK